MRAGYGFGALDGRYTSIPELGLTVSDTGHEYILGWRLSRATRDNSNLELRLQGTRRERNDRRTAPEHAIGLQLLARH